MSTQIAEDQGLYEMTAEEIELVGGGWGWLARAIFSGLFYDTGKRAFDALWDAGGGAVDRYVDHWTRAETSTDYQNHPRYIGIGGPF